VDGASAWDRRKPPPERCLGPLASHPSTTLHIVITSLEASQAGALHLGRSVRPKLMQELLGHATVAMTPDTSSHMLPGMGCEAAEAIGEALG
jgi:hypothetical protein